MWGLKKNQLLRIILRLPVRESGGRVELEDARKRISWREEG